MTRQQLTLFGIGRTGARTGGRRSARCRTVGNTDPHHASVLSLRCVSAAGIIAKGHNGHVGYAGGPRGCSGAGAAPPALGKGEEKVAKGGQIGSGGRGPLQHRNSSQFRPGRGWKVMPDDPLCIARRAEEQATSSAGLRASTKTQQCGSVLSEPICSVPLPSLCAAFPRPGSSLQVVLGVWATPAGRTAAAAPAPTPLPGRQERRTTPSQQRAATP